MPSRSVIGILLWSDSTIIQSKVTGNVGDGIVCLGGSKVKVTECFFDGNGRAGIAVREKSKVELLKCKFGMLNGQQIDKEPGSSCAPCQGNTAIVPANSVAPKPVPGVRFIKEES